MEESPVRKGTAPVFSPPFGCCHVHATSNAVSSPGKVCRAAAWRWVLATCSGLRRSDEIVGTKRNDEASQLDAAACGACRRRSWSPLLGTLLFLLLSFNPKDAFHFGGFLALSLGVFFAYFCLDHSRFLPFWLFSPLAGHFQGRNKLWPSARRIHRRLLGWLFCSIFVAPSEGTGMPSPQTCGVLTGIVGAAVLQSGGARVGEHSGSRRGAQMLAELGRIQ